MSFRNLSFLVVAFTLVFSNSFLVVEGRPKDEPAVVHAKAQSTTADYSDCTGDYPTQCNCEIDSPFVGPTLSCNVSSNQDLIEIQRKLKSRPTETYGIVRLNMKTKLDIPEDVLGGMRARELELSCSDRYAPLGSIHVGAFKSTTNYTYELMIENCDLTKTSFAFLSQFTVMTDFDVKSSTVKELLNMPSLPQLKSVSLYNLTDFVSWYTPSQTPNLENIYMGAMPHLDDKNMDSILSSMTKNFLYPKLSLLVIPLNSLSRIPSLAFNFPALTVLDLESNPIKTLVKGSVNKGSTKLEYLVLDSTELEEIEPGAFVGDFSSTRIDLGNNAMTSFPSSVFKDLLKSMVNHSGYVTLWSNPIVFDCGITWLLIDNRDLLRRVYGAFDDEISFKYQSTYRLKNC